MSAFAAQPDVGIPAGGRHGTYGERRLGAGNENTGSHFASDGQAHHVVAGGGDHRDQRAADAALAPAIREVGLRRTVGSASRRAQSAAGAAADGAASPAAVRGEVFRFQRESFSREAAGGAWHPTQLQLGEAGVAGRGTGAHPQEARGTSPAAGAPPASRNAAAFGR